MKRKQLLCGVLLQHSYPQNFIEKLSSTINYAVTKNKPVTLMEDCNLDLLLKKEKKTKFRTSWIEQRKQFCPCKESKQLQRFLLYHYHYIGN